MKQIIVSDTTTLITLEKLQQLSLLCQLFRKIIIPESVYKELLAGLQTGEQSDLASCIKIEAVKPSKRLDNLLLLLDRGEAEAIELASLKQFPLIIDEKKGRKIAQQAGLTVTGFSGLLALSLRRKVLTSSQAISLLHSAIETGHRLSPSLYQQVLAVLSEG